MIQNNINFSMILYHDIRNKRNVNQTDIIYAKTTLIHAKKRNQEFKGNLSSCFRFSNLKQSLCANEGFQSKPHGCFFQVKK